MRPRLIWLALLVMTSVGCADRDLRGSYERSSDGKTYLAILDNNGGGCGPIFLDGEEWRHPIGQAAQIEPGQHTISCGGDIGFTVPAGVIYRFDYWGP